MPGLGVKGASSIVESGEQPKNAAANPGHIHWPVFRQIKGKYWAAPKRTLARTLRVNPHAEYGKIPGFGFANIVAGVGGFLATGGTGALLGMGLDKVAGANATQVWYEPVRDVARLGVEGFTGLMAYPIIGHKLTGKQEIGQAIWVGGTLILAADVIFTAGKYIMRAITKAPAEAAAPAAATAGMALMGLSGLGDLIKGTAFTAETAQVAQPAQVAGMSGSGVMLDGELSKLTDKDAELMLLGELQRNSELKQMAGLSGAVSGSLIR